MAKLHVKKNDEVVIICGNDRVKAGKVKTGKVLSVDTKKERVCVEGFNLRKKAIKPSQKNPAGGIIEFAAPIHVSNVMLKTTYDAKSKNKKG